MAVKIALINMKGGVGKSTLTVNLAWQFAAWTNWGKKVLVIDLDPQFNASQYLLGPQKYQHLLLRKQKTIWDVFEQGTSTPSGGKAPAVSPQDVIVNVASFHNTSARIDLIPSRLDLAWSLRNPAQKERKLANLIKKVDGVYDLILVDCAPTESVLTTAAYLTCDQILVPVAPEYLSSIGLPLLVRSISEFEEQSDGEKKISIAGIVFNGTEGYFPEEKKAKEEVRALAKKEGIHVFTSSVKYSKSYPKGAREGKPIFRTSYARSKVAADFRAFAFEFAKRVGL